MTKAYMILDGMWGSCGKGALAAYLALRRQPGLIVSNFGSNAGHSAISAKDEFHIITRLLPTGLVYRGAQLLLGPGSIIDPTLLLTEIEEFNHQFNVSTRLLIHPHAAIITEVDKDLEASELVHIGSTRKGVGAAACRKIMRGPFRFDPLDGHPEDLPRVAKDVPELSQYVLESPQQYWDVINRARVIQIESAQGFELSLNHGAYPYCTGRDITPEAILNDVAIPRRMLGDVFVVCRTFPIRVGNEYKDGEMIGWSGPVYPDMKEMTWEEVSAITGQNLLERTTVTKKVRRVFSFSETQFERMLQVMAPCKVFLNFLNYLPVPEREPFIKKLLPILRKYDSRIELVGLGPDDGDIFPIPFGG